jgi:hypothetical protein
MHVKETGFQKCRVDPFLSGQDTVASSCENSNELSINGGQFSDQTRGYKLLEKFSAQFT